MYNPFILQRKILVTLVMRGKAPFTSFFEHLFVFFVLICYNIYVYHITTLPHYLLQHSRDRNAYAADSHCKT